jgi:hypothetical protein
MSALISLEPYNYYPGGLLTLTPFEQFLTRAMVWPPQEAHPYPTTAEIDACYILQNALTNQWIVQTLRYMAHVISPPSTTLVSLGGLSFKPTPGTDCAVGTNFSGT